jgi:predicted PhzF superfamily epimerase YddE/YHI9
VRYFQVNAFTTKPAGGNPAGVCPLESWPDDALMQRIAATFMISEIAFVVPQPDGYGLRWFTPKAEIDLCGHATLATAHVLYRHLGRAEPVMRFHTRSGELRVSRAGDALQLDFPRRPVEPVAPPPGLDEALGARPLEVHAGVSLLCLFANAGQVRDLRPRFGMIGRLDTHAVIATAPGEDCDFVSRFFAPGVGIDEDPVTGSAHCSLAPFWSARLGRKVLAARQVSSRGGELECECSGERVFLRGRALTVLDGQIFV